jgi:hypothetical protein
MAVRAEERLRPVPRLQPGLGQLPEQLWGRFDYRHLTLRTKGYCLSANSFNAEARVITCAAGPPRPQDTSQYWSHSDVNP